MGWITCALEQWRNGMLIRPRVDFPQREMSGSWARIEERWRAYEDARLAQLTGTVFASTDQRVEPPTLVVAQRHDVLLYDSLFRGHAMHPRCYGAIDSEIHRKINDEALVAVTVEAGSGR